FFFFIRGVIIPLRHGRACPGHPRSCLFLLQRRKTWTPDTRVYTRARQRRDTNAGHDDGWVGAKSYAASTERLAPSACAILTRLPAGASGPVTRQTVSSMRMVPMPSTIGFSG